MNLTFFLYDSKKSFAHDNMIGLRLRVRHKEQLLSRKI